jgi:hypothetical protein
MLVETGWQGRCLRLKGAWVGSSGGMIVGSRRFAGDC